MQAENIGTTSIDDFDPDAIIPVEILSCDIAQRSRSQDASKIMELGRKLLSSAERGDFETVRDLMSKGAPLTANGLGTSALHFSAQNNHLDIADFLLRSGISVDARTKVDRTPLHMAAYEGHYHMVQLLLNKGADVDSRDMLKMTPLHWAVEREHMEVVQMLLEHGADVGAISKFDKTPISLAYERNRLDMIQILRQDKEMFSVQRKANDVSHILPTSLQEAMQFDNEKSEKRFQQQKKRSNSQGSNMNKKQRMFLQQIQMSDDEQEKGRNKFEFENADYADKNHKDAEMENPLRFLQAHGITFLPIDEKESIVENAMESGQTVVLTEAGKLALNLTKTLPINMKRIQMGARRGNSKKVITICTDQLHQNSSANAPRGPNILKRNSGDCKAGKIYFAPLQNAQSIPQFSKTKNNLNVIKAANVKEPMLHIDDEIEEITEDGTRLHEDDATDVQETDVVVLNRQLVEARRQIEEFRKQLKKKEEEAESYKQQLRIITTRRVSQ